MTTQVKRYQRQNVFTPGVTVWSELELIDTDGTVIDSCKVGDYQDIDSASPLTKALSNIKVHEEYTQSEGLPF